MLLVVVGVIVYCAVNAHDFYVHTIVLQTLINGPT